MDFLHETSSQPRLVFLDGHRHGLAVNIGNDEAPSVCYLDVETLDADDRFGRWWRRRWLGAVAPCAWLLGDEVFTEETCCVGVVVHAEHQLTCGRVNAGAPSDHLVEADWRLEVPKEDNISHTWHVHPGC